MCAPKPFTQSSLALALAFSAAPALAQQSAQDFQLPPAPAPSASPQVEGPADDSGIIPVGPRALPTSASSAPATVPTPTPSESAASRPVVQPLPASRGSTQQNEPTAPRRAAQADQAPRLDRGRSGAANSPVENATASPSNQAAQTNGQTETSTPSPATLPAPLSVPAPLPAPPPSGAEPAPAGKGINDGLLASWPWWAAGLALALLLALLAGWVFRRKRFANAASAGLAHPVGARANEGAALNKETAASAKSDPAHQLPNLALQLEVEQLSRSMMAMTLKCRVTLNNRSERAAREIAICADLVCANRRLPMDAQIANAASFLPEVGNADRLGPHKTQSVAATLTIPMQQVVAFKHGNRPMFVPLVRVRMDCKDQEPVFKTFVVGIAADPTLQSSSKLHPVPLDGIPGSYQSVRSRPIANPTPS